jgi:hypothetical protein
VPFDLRDIITIASSDFEIQPLAPASVMPAADFS